MQTLVRPTDDLLSILNAAKPGSEIVLDDGVYKGGGRVRAAGRKGVPVVLRARNKGGAVITGGTDALQLYSCNHFIVQDLVFRDALRCGLYISESAFVEVSSCVMLRNGVTGLLSGHAADLTVTDCESSFNKAQHGIYHSGPADRPRIERNFCHDNGVAGIQLNAGKNVPNPARGELGDRVIEGPIIRGNRCERNGLINAGAAINLASIRHGLIAGNRLRWNKAGGIALFADAPQDFAVRYGLGSQGCVIEDNYIEFLPGEGRMPIGATQNSTGNLYRRNEIISRHSSVWVDASSSLVDGGGNIWSLPVKVRPPAEGVSI